MSCGAPDRDEWDGATSATLDGNPFVGRTDRPGVSIGAFHASGLQPAWSVGNLVASVRLGDGPSAVPERLSPSRFDGDGRS